MNYGIANLSIVPVRRECLEQSEMVTQLLFGEHFEILKEEGNWYSIRIAFDKYEGWIDKKLCKLITDETFTKLESKPQVVSTDIINNVYLANDKAPKRITIGSSLPNFNKKTNSFSIEEEKYKFEGTITPYNKKDIRKNAITIALSLLNTPYLWGGKSPFGIDCSGLVQVIYKVLGITLPRDADFQVNCGDYVNFIDEAKEGDLAFFDNNEGRIIHVGIIYQKNKIIHCSGKVRIDLLDHQGIFNESLKKYTHKLRIIKSVIN